MPFYTHVACMGNAIYYRGIQDGKRIRQKIDYTPTLYLPTKKDSPFKTLAGEALEPRSFQSINDARDFIKQYEGVEGFTIYGNNKFEYAYIAEQHPEELIHWNQQLIVIAYIDIEVGSANGFPTVEKTEEPITAITVKLSTKSQYYVFACGEFKTDDPTINYYNCKNEHDLIQTFLSFWNSEDPDVVSGWSIKTFDIPYLYNRITKLMGEEVAKWLSPWGKVYAKTEQFYGRAHEVYDLVGIGTLDYLQLFRKYAANFSQPSYKLNFIANLELKEKKLDYDEYDSLHQLYLKDFQKFINYNIQDVRLVERLNAKGRLIDMALTLAYDNKTNYGDVFSQVRMWDAICYNHLLRKNIIVPPNVHKSKDQAYEGAYVKDPQLGAFNWVASFDLNSLYPHLIMQYNLSPEMLVEVEEYTDAMRVLAANDKRTLLHGLLDQKFTLDLEGVTITPNGQFFRTQKQGFLPEIMQKMYDDRVIYKKKMLEAEKAKEAETDKDKRKALDDTISRYKNLQLAKKVGLNSAYGAMGNEYFRFFDTRIAEAVTLAGQLSIRWIENKLNAYFNNLLKTSMDYIIASDTDSVYVNLEPLIKQLYKELPETNKVITTMDKICQQKIIPFIDQQYAELAKYVKAYAQKMQMKRESLVDRAIWTAKKRYILNVWDSEGVRYAEPKLKIQGLEAIKSSTPEACKTKIKDALKIVMQGDQDKLHAHIEAFRKEFRTLPPEEIAFPRSVNGLAKNQCRATATLEGIAPDPTKMASGAPIHVKGSLLYNHYIESLELTHSYPYIQEGEKIKFIYLKEPNRFKTPVIAFPQRAPKEFKLQECIDYQTQFNKSFEEPLKIILDTIGWTVERKNSLDAFLA
jgi:DNA polymerase elongation subunit (family B)